LVGDEADINQSDYGIGVFQPERTHQICKLNEVENSESVLNRGQLNECLDVGNSFAIVDFHTPYMRGEIRTCQEPKKTDQQKSRVSFQ
jgi:hypothetical protein